MPYFRNLKGTVNQVVLEDRYSFQFAKHQLKLNIKIARILDWTRSSVIAIVYLKVFINGFFTPLLNKSKTNQF